MSIDPKQLAIIDPDYFTILKSMSREKFEGVCPNTRCNLQFTFEGSYILKKMLPHIHECRRLNKIQGSYNWLKYMECGGCGIGFAWDFPIYIEPAGGQPQFKGRLKITKYKGPILVEGI